MYIHAENFFKLYGGPVVQQAKEVWIEKFLGYTLADVGELGVKLFQTFIPDEPGSNTGVSVYEAKFFFKTAEGAVHTFIASEPGPIYFIGGNPI